ncbi:MAG: VanZ family protein [Desulfomonilaceae bacterium]
MSIGDKTRLGIPVMIYCGGIFCLSSLSTVPAAFTSVPDKVGHVILYAGLGFLVALYFKRNHQLSTLPIWGLAAAFCFIYGISDEFHQYFVEGRCAEIGDVIADLIGGVLGAILSTELIRRNLFPVLNLKR